MDPKEEQTSDLALKIIEQTKARVGVVAESASKMAARVVKPVKAAKTAGQTTLPAVGGKKGEDILGITTSKSTNFAAWYQEVVLKGELVEYYDISGFFVLRPAAMSVWNSIRDWFQERIKAMGVEEASFPMFLTEKSLEAEKSHVEGFAPELAWVTKAGEKDLEFPIAVRPTSEAIMYPYFAKWIRSYRDLPLRLNQWCSVIRWEAKQTTPFLRTREFLWQEGHTAHLTEELARTEVLEILELYAGVYEQLLAVPVVRGRKTKNETFAGGHYTTTVEGYVPQNGRGIQGATSHCLGQNFSKMFNIVVEDPANKGSHIRVWQNSWGLSTRALGVMVMLHGDDKGLVLPPRVAPVQVILIPVGITKSTSDADRQKHRDQLSTIETSLQEAGIRTKTDLREGHTPAWKFNDWELKGVPLRLEFGPKDAAKEVVSFTRRDTGEKGTFPISSVGASANEYLEIVQKNLYAKADQAFREHRIKVTKWDDVIPALDNKNVVLIPHCLVPECEDSIKKLTTGNADEEGLDGIRVPIMGMKSLCIPFEQPDGLFKGETNCLNPECSRLADQWCMFGRSY